MEKMNDLKDLLKHEIYDLYSAEKQIIKALPAMIEKANNSQLKTALQQHLEVTQNQLIRLGQVQGLLNEDAPPPPSNENKGLLARLFKRNHVCRGMQGLIEEGQKIMEEEMSPEVLDAAIVASAQKIEHYEICGYGTARAFAKELSLNETINLLEQTLNEKYEADNRLTELAVGRLNQKAEGEAYRSNIRFEASKPQTDREFGNERSTIQEPEMELVSERKKSDNSKKLTATREKAPKGEAERRETNRETGVARQVVSNNKNSKSAKSSSGRKATDGRTTGTKRGR